MSDREQLKAERQTIYGDPRENHRGIAQGWAGLLQPHADLIRRGDPLPEWVVALMMVALKLNRCRRRYHADNYDDLRNYLDFAQEWQSAQPPHHRIYIAGPYSAPELAGREANVQRAAEAATQCMRRGHDAHCPHAATHPIEQIDQGEWVGYEQYMRLDFGIIDRWATALLYLGSSRGADRELERAQALGLTIFRSVDEVPDLGVPRS